MADERDPQVSRRYRELGSEEPPRAMDDAILTASRRAGARRLSWYIPLAAAAVALLAVGIALQVEHPQPDMEAVTAPTEAKEAPAKPLRHEAPQAERQENAVGSGVRRERRIGSAQEQSPVPAAAPAPIPQTAPAARAARADAIEETPERALERIAELRKQGRHDEADQALAEFRRRYPEYLIPESTRAKVEKE
jgi:hypothetical protein